MANTTENSRPNPFFIADHLALDFINSVAAPTGTEIEWLKNGSDLLLWLEQAELLSIEVATQFHKQTDFTELDAVAIEARNLREWFRSYISNNAGKPVLSSLITELDPINNLLAQDNSFKQLEHLNITKPANKTSKQHSPGFSMRLHRQFNTPHSLLILLAEIMADLICHADFIQVKKCEGAGCTLWFQDVSKNHARRWCSMAVCGNRAKATTHRAKRQSATD